MRWSPASSPKHRKRTPSAAPQSVEPHQLDTCPVAATILDGEVFVTVIKDLNDTSATTVRLPRHYRENLSGTDIAFQALTKFPEVQAIYKATCMTSKPRGRGDQMLMNKKISADLQIKELGMLVTAGPTVSNEAKHGERSGSVALPQLGILPLIIKS